MMNTPKPNRSRPARWIVALMPLALFAPSCDRQEAPPESDPAPPATTPDAQTPLAPQDAADQPSPQPAANDASSDEQEVFTKPVSILPSTQLARRPEDSLTISKIAGARSLIWYVPNTWNPETPTRPNGLGELRIPAPDKADYGDGFVYVYGDDRPSIYETLNGWLSEIENPAYTPEIREIDFADGTPLLVTEFAGVGTYNPADSEYGPQENMMVLGLIVEGGPEGTLCFKAVGPRELIEAHRFRWNLLMRTIRIQNKPRGY